MTGKEDAKIPQNDADTNVGEDDDERALTVYATPDPEILAAVKVPAWCDARHIVAAWALSEGYSKAKAATAAGVSRGAVYDWLKHPERGPSFVGLVERLSPLTGVAQSSARVALAKELLQKLVERDVGHALNKTDAVGVMRFIREEVGARGIGSMHPAGVVVQQYFKGPTTINMGDSGPEGEAVDGGGWELEEESEAGDPEAETLRQLNGLLGQAESLEEKREP